MDVPGGLAGVQVSLNGQAPPPPPDTSYNIPGVLHFLKSEWVRFERERAAWELEKVELQVCLFVCLFVYLFVYLFDCLFTCLFVCLLLSSLR